MPVIKASFMLFLRHVFGHMRTFRLALWILGVYVFIWWLTTFWISVFQCWPMSANWSGGEVAACIPNIRVRNANVQIALKRWLTVQDMVLLGSFIERCERCGHHNDTNPLSSGVFKCHCSKELSLFQSLLLR